MSHVGCWWDDYTIVVSLALNWVMAILRWVQVLRFGFGRHINFISVEEAHNFQKSFLAVQVVYFANACLTKASLLLLYHRIFSVVRRFRWVLWFAGFLIVSWFIACTTTAIAGCSPVSYFWDKNQPGSCIDEINFFRWNGVGNAFLDILVLCIPFPMLWKIKTNRRQKWLLSGIFMLGSFVCIVSVIRVTSFIVQDRQDPTYTTIDTAAWSSIEQSIGIICACLPTLRPFFRRLSGTCPTDLAGPNPNKSEGSDAQSPRTASPQSRWSSGRVGDEDPELGHSYMYPIITLPTGSSINTPPGEEDVPLHTLRGMEMEGHAPPNHVQSQI
ncbi:hypothetical protein FE257_000451 [Aspergillus nanangensis]|uniref:Rhodopsin domain-containing protein n=1 Tax=Aspergillus nanangensis TaxID=2582783 RepID=A0AAD4CW83_ASPNN|nr:hypothetical protein FE257_000451 [Aspergillus nanangensis]